MWILYRYFLVSSIALLLNNASNTNNNIPSVHVLHKTQSKEIMQNIGSTKAKLIRTPRNLEPGEKSKQLSSVTTTASNAATHSSIKAKSHPKSAAR